MMRAFQKQIWEPIMKARAFMLTATALLAALATAAPPPPGGTPGGGAVVRPPPPHGGPGYGYRPPVNVYYGGPYGWGGWGGWGWPGYYWPYYGGYGYYGYYGSYWPYYGGSYGYLPPTVVYGPPAVVTSTTGITYIEREPGTVSTQQQQPQAPAAANVPPPPDAEPSTSVPSGTAPTTGQWWYFCSSPRGAYPYVRECPGGWERVPAVPPAPKR